MKKLTALLTLLLCAALLTGCAAQEAKPKMYITPAELNEDEQAIAKLLGANANQNIFDYVVDETLQSVSVKTYELVNGQWEPSLGGGGTAVSGTKGRLALDFDVLPDRLRVAFQHEGAYSATENKALKPLNAEGLSRMSSRMIGQTAVEYEREIPLVMQIVTRKSEVRSYAPEDFYDPSQIAADGHDHVYVATITFSQQPLE